jgi:hypothetical protein
MWFFRKDFLLRGVKLRGWYLQSVIDYCLQTPPRLLLIIVVATGLYSVGVRTLTTQKSIIQH